MGVVVERIEMEFVFERPCILDDEFDLLALAHVHLCRRVSH